MSATDVPDDGQDVLLEITDLQKYFPVTKGIVFKRTIAHVKAVDGVSLSVRKGETVGLVGESGCGKTTIGRCILKLERPTAGHIRYHGEDVHDLDAQSTKKFRRKVQAVFQDPYSSLNPRMRVGDIITEPLTIHGVQSDPVAMDARLRELLDICGLPKMMANRYPHEMSGGQRQRVGIARALALNPEFIVCDEAVSALDVSIQAQVINLLEDLREEFNLTYLFIGHDLSVVRHLCHRVVVMYLGKVVEVAETDELFDNPKHPYTRALLESVPVADPTLEKQRAHYTLPGEVPSPIDPPAGCVFHPRCSLAVASCNQERPSLEEFGRGHWAACPVVTS